MIGVAAALVVAALGTTLPLGELASCGLDRLASGRSPDCCRDRGEARLEEVGHGCCRVDPARPEQPALLSSAGGVPPAPAVHLAAHQLTPLLPQQLEAPRTSAWPAGVPPPAEPPTATTVLLL